MIVPGCTLGIHKQAWQHAALCSLLCPSLPHLRLSTRALRFNEERPGLSFSTTTYHMDSTKAKLTQDPGGRCDALNITGNSKQS